MSDLEKMSGEIPKRPQLSLNELGINGQTGKFVIKKVTEGLKKEKETDKYGRYSKEEVGEKITVIFLKVRRILKQYRKGLSPLVTNEHNHKDNMVTLFGDSIEKNIASTLRENYEGLRTQQIIYAIYDGELVRLVIKGASIGSESKPKGEFGFYDYIKSFKKDDKDEHFYEHQTELYSIKEESSMGSYYAMGYKKGKKLTEEEMKEVEEKMTIAFNHCTEVDEYYGGKSKEVIQEDVPTIEIDEEEISDDIPF